MSRAFGLGGGTAAPGRLASRVDPHALEKLVGRLGDGIVLIAGTNGKTTTARILAEVLASHDRHVVHNRSGANMVSGIVSTLTADVSADGRHPGIAILETDEAALPEVLRRTSPRLIVLTNLFRDQLDRYGEVDFIWTRWRTALQRLDASTTVIVNADDPQLVALTDGLAATVRYFGLQDTLYQAPALSHAAEVSSCQRCGEPFAYRAVLVGHLGDWYCPTCEVARPRLDVAGHDIELWSHDFQSLKVMGVGASGRFDVGLPGLYNTYNIVAALAAAGELGVPASVAQRSVARFRGAFGRAERVLYRGRSLMIVLVKNPVGCNEVLRTISGVDSALVSPVLLCLNNDAADGRDVSWIWDVDFESFASASAHFFCAGSRWADLRNRLYYAGLAPERIHALGPDLGKAMDAFTAALPVGGAGFVLPTYSAMLAVRRTLAQGRDAVAMRDD